MQTNANHTSISARHRPSVHRCLILATMLLSLGFVGGGGMAEGQSLRERIEHMKALRAAEEAERQERLAEAEAKLRLALRTPLPEVQLTDVTVSTAFQWWAEASGVQIAIHWRAMEREGFDPDEPIDLQLKNVPAGQVLALLMAHTSQQIDFDEYSVLVWEITPHYIEIMTKRMALRRTITKAYPLDDLLQRIPHFTDAPNFDLDASLREEDAGGGGGGDLFQEADDEDEEQERRIETIEDLANLIRTMIEPDLWRANGGEFASLRIINERLIIKAPRFVHEQIELPPAARRYWVPRRPASSSSETTDVPNEKVSSVGKKSKPVSSVADD